MTPTAYKPIYTTFDSVKIRLQGKVTFKDSTTPIGRGDRVMSDELLGQMIVDAETAVEQELRGRYAVPFRSKRSGTYEQLPDHTKRAIRTIVDQKACMLILIDSFGSGTHINADGYLKNLTETYELLLRRLLGQDMEGENFGEKRFRRTPPLDDLMLSVTNSADTGFIGAPMDAGARSPFDQRVTGSEFAANQINDPSIGILYGFGGRRVPR